MPEEIGIRLSLLSHDREALENLEKRRGSLPVGVDRQKHRETSRLIAIVEDDDQLITLFRDMLERDGRWRLQFFCDGQDAGTRLPELGAHLILLDVGLPNLDGVSLYKILRGHRKTRNTPIIIITGSHDWELQRMGLRTGLLLRKPFHVRELLFMIQAVLGNGSQE